MRLSVWACVCGLSGRSKGIPLFAARPLPATLRPYLSVRLTRCRSSDRCWLLFTCWYLNSLWSPPVSSAHPRLGNICCRRSVIPLGPRQTTAQSFGKLKEWWDELHLSGMEYYFPDKLNHLSEHKNITLKTCWLNLDECFSNFLHWQNPMAHQTPPTKNIKWHILA